MSASEAAVCDASVLASIAFGDPNSVGALGLIRSKRLFAPSLIRYELAHVAVSRAMVSADNADEGDRVAEAFAAALRVPMTLVEPSWPQVLHLALGYGLSAYDASYLQVALALRIPLATFDRRLAHAAEQLGVGTRSGESV